MKVIFFIKYYDGFVKSLEEKLKSYPNLNYQESLDLVTRESANIFAPFIGSLKRRNISAELLIPNFYSLQAKWCQENGEKMRDNWQFEIPKKQLAKNTPDILFMNSNFEYFGDFLEDVKGYYSKICAWISCPFDKQLNLAQFDHIFTLFAPHQQYFQSKNIPCTLTSGGFDSTVLNELNFERIHDFTFVGGIGGYHNQREKYLKYLIKKTPLKIWGYGYKSQHPLKNIIKQLNGGFVYQKAFQGQAWGKDMISILSQSKITFNSHGDIARGHAVNMRMFEATGAGALLLTDESNNSVNFFEPEKEIITYDSPTDAADKVKYYLLHEEERIAIAKAGQKKTLENYTYEHLTPVYVTIFEQLLSK